MPASGTGRVNRAVHADAIAVLSRWRPDDPEQNQLRQQYLGVLRSQPDATHRGARPDHLTAGALVVDAGREHVLLDLHGKVGRWLQFGGHIEPDDTTLAGTALREVQEESGIVDGVRLVSDLPLRLDRHPAPCAADARDHLDVQFLAECDGRPAATVSPESHDVRWFAVDTLPDDTDASVRALVRAALTTR